MAGSTTEKTYNFTWIEGYLDYVVSINPINLGLLSFVSFVSAAVSLGAISYFEIEASKKFHDFQRYQTLFSAAMMNFIVAGGLINSFFWWEVLGFGSFLVIGFYNKDTKNGEATLFAFLLNRLADLLLLSGILSLWFQNGTQEFSSTKILDNPQGYGGLLLLLGTLGKSAQVPFQFWLNRAMVGPTPGSALIHAATMVTAGVILLAKTSILWVDYAGWLSIIGAATYLIGAISSLGQKELKSVLAFSTISQLGLMYFLLGESKGESLVLYVISHGLGKALLFLLAGYIGLKAFPEVGERLNIQTNKVLAFFHIVVILSLCGFPLTLGFFSKEFILQSINLNLNNSFILFIGSFLTSLYLGRYFFSIFSLAHTAAQTKALQSAVFGVGLLLAIPSLWLVWEINPLGTPELFFKLFPLSKAGHLSYIIPILLTVASILGLILSYQLANQKIILPRFINLSNEVEKNLYKQLQRFINFSLRFLQTKVATLEKAQVALPNYLAKTTVVSAWVGNLIDQHLIDGLVKLGSPTAKIGSYIAKGVQGKSTQQFATVAAIVLIILWLSVGH